MFSFLKSIFAPKSAPEPKGCGGQCACACKPEESVDLGLSDNDKGTLAGLDERIVVGKIIDIQSHSNPEITKVRVTQCDLGNGKIEQILCGGTNIAVGMVVPVATVGSDLGGGFVIGERAIRGEMSHGMICARAELGLSAESETKGQIWSLSAGLENKLGTPINQL